MCGVSPRLSLSTYSIQTVTNLDNNYEADYMDAMADRLADMEEAMRETDPEQWEGYDDQA